MLQNEKLCLSGELTFALKVLLFTPSFFIASCFP